MANTSSTGLSPVIDYTLRDFNSVKQGMIDYLKFVRPNDFTDYTESQLVVAVIELIAWGVANNMFVTDRKANEVYFKTARERRNIVLLARNVGYKPYLATSASVDVVVDTTNLAVNTGDTFIVPAGTQVYAAGGIPFETNIDHTLVCTNAATKTFTVDGGGATTTPTFSLLQGETKTDTFTGSGTPFQEFTLTQYPVIADTITFYVGGTAADTGSSLWTEAESLVLGDPKDVDNQNIYEVLIDENDQATVRTGDGITGAVIGTGVTAFASYRVGGGSKGNISEGAVSASVQATKNGTTQVSLRISNPVAAGGGDDRETIDSIKFFAPLNTLTHDSAVSASDYFVHSNGFSDGENGVIAKAAAICDPSSGASGNIITIYVWVKDNNNVLVPTVSTSLKSALKDYLDSIKVVCTYVSVADGTNVPVDVQTLIQVDPRFLEDQIKAQVTAVVAAVFKEDRVRYGNVLHLSWIYDEVMSIPGVSWASVTAPNSVIENAVAQEIAVGTLPSQSGATATEFIFPTTFSGGVLAGSTSAVQGYYANYRLEITSGTGLGQSRRITAYAYDNGNLRKGRVDKAWVVQPDSTSVFRLWHPRKIALASTASATNDFYDHRPISIVGGTGIHQTRTIVDYDGTTKIAVIDRSWTVYPEATSSYTILNDLACTQREALVLGPASTVTVISNLDI